MSKGGLEVGSGSGWVGEVERSQPGKASRPRVSSRVSGPGRSSGAAGLQASHPHSPRLPARDRPAGLARAAAATLAAAATGAAPRGGAGPGAERPGRPRGREAGRGPQRAAGRVAGSSGSVTPGRCSALPTPHAVGVPGKAGDGEGEALPRGMPSTHLGDNLLGPEKDAQPPESVAPGICTPTGGGCGDSRTLGSRSGPGRTRARVSAWSPNLAYQANLGRVWSCPSLTFPDCGSENKANPRAPRRFSENNVCERMLSLKEQQPAVWPGSFLPK